MSTMQVQPHPAVLATALPGDENGEEIVLLHLESNYYYSLNPTGAEIWQGLSHGRSLGEISQTLVDHYAVTLAEAEQAVIGLLDDLTAEALVQPVAVAAHPQPNHPAGSGQ